jgi:hypothetical protein
MLGYLACFHLHLLTLYRSTQILPHRIHTWSPLPFSSSHIDVVINVSQDVRSRVALYGNRSCIGVEADHTNCYLIFDVDIYCIFVIDIMVSHRDVATVIHYGLVHSGTHQYYCIGRCSKLREDKPITGQELTSCHSRRTSHQTRAKHAQNDIPI